MNKEILKKQLVTHEGLKLHAYQDSLGFWTIGVGRLIDKRRGGGITSEEALYLLDNDIDRTMAELEPEPVWQYVKDDDVRARVIVDMAFNLGVPGLKKFRRMIACLAASDFDGAAQCMLDSLWARQVGRRAQVLSHMMKEGRDFYSYA